MKNIIYLFLFLSMPVISMDAPQLCTGLILVKELKRPDVTASEKNKRKEAKKLAQSTKFLHRLPYFKSAHECYIDMTTDSGADSNYEEGIMTKEELDAWKVTRNEQAIQHDLKIQKQTKNQSVATLLTYITPDQYNLLYSKLYSNELSRLPIHEALIALGYEADVE